MSEINSNSAWVKSLRPYQSPSMVKEHILDLITQISTLKPYSQTLVFTDSTHQSLICLRGTIPQWFKNQKYNLPVAIYLLDDYPISPPAAFIVPTTTLVLKLDNPYIFPSGQVNHNVDCFKYWGREPPNLVSIVFEFSSLFGKYPPLWQDTSHPRPIPPIRYQKPVTKPAIPPRISDRTVQPPPQTTTTQASNDMDIIEMVKKTQIKELEPKVNQQLLNIRTTAIFVMKELFENEEQLKSRAPKLSLALDNISNLQSVFKPQFQAIKNHTATQKGFLDASLSSQTSPNNVTHSGSTLSKPLIDLSSLVEPFDPLSAQLVDVVAKDRAISDLLSQLEIAFERGDFETGEYLKHVRALSRQQFTQRLALIQIQQRQKQLYSSYNV